MGGSVWSSTKIRTHLHEIIEPVPASGTPVEGAAYELHLGEEAYISGAKEKTQLKRGEIITIASGQIALLLTEEKIKLPTDVMAFISLKTSVKLPGLINVSGFHVDPGFEGKLVFTVYNAGTETCAFSRGQKMFLIWLVDLTDDEGQRHVGSRQGQDTIPAQDISRLTSAGASPAHLDERMRKLEITLTVYGALLLALLVGIITIILRWRLTS